jgi:hypothetical protein
MKQKIQGCHPGMPWERCPRDPAKRGSKDESRDPDGAMMTMLLEIF